MNKEILISAIDGIDDKYIAEFSDTEELKLKFGEEIKLQKTETSEKRRNRRKTSRLLLLVAVISVLVTAFICIMATGGKNTDLDDVILNIRPEIYDIIYETHHYGAFDMFFEKLQIPALSLIVENMSVVPEKLSDASNPIVSQLIENGFEDVVLPKELLSDKWSISDMTFSTDKIASWNATICLEDGENRKCNISVRQSGFTEADKEYYYHHYTYFSRVESFIVNGLDIVVVEYDINHIPMVSYFTKKEAEPGKYLMCGYNIDFEGFAFEEIVGIMKTLP